ncbi:alpha subunit of pyruvate dehydrogenase [Haplosporangium sp. Z 27]|nr:alpha subunit of pyruvate dehydrogenase [Haplosporangium sp. Z 27]
MLLIPRNTLRAAIAATPMAKPMAYRSFASTAIARNLTIAIPESSFESYHCDKPSLEVNIDKEELVNMYKNMATIRRMELTVDGFYKSQLIRGFCHLSTGQEAVAVGIEAALAPEDKLITAYRAHGFTHMRGGSVKSIIAELFGRKDGISKGKGGSMHMFTKNYYGGNGIVGAQVPLGTGIAFSQRYQESKGATFTLYGDGAANQGQVFESFNMAKLWDLPCIFVCENNRYGMGTSAARSSASTSYFTRGDYIPGIKVDAMNILAVYNAAKYAREWAAVQGKGPLLLEMVTYRYAGHSVTDPGTTYRARDEIQYIRAHHDAITILKQYMIEHKVISEDDAKKLDKAARAEVDEAVEAAKNSPEPEMNSVWDDVYVDGTSVPLLRGREPEESHSYRS